MERYMTRLQRPTTYRAAPGAQRYFSKWGWAFSSHGDEEAFFVEIPLVKGWKDTS